MTIDIPLRYYGHQDASDSGDKKECGFPGWQRVTMPFDPQRIAIVSMHAWHPRTPEEFPGAWRAHPYFNRTKQILHDVFPPLLEATRRAGVKVFHVVGGGNYYNELPGYLHAKELVGESEPAIPVQGIEVDQTLEEQRLFRKEMGYPGKDNREDVGRFHEALDFGDEARPVDDEGIAENGAQLAALCRESGVNHLLYCGFALNWCLLLSPGGMADMQRYGVMCSTIADATTALENRETIRNETAKEVALWRVALGYGFVFDSKDLIEVFSTL